jgi:hypothetical protein
MSELIPFFCFFIIARPLVFLGKLIFAARFQAEK